MANIDVARSIKFVSIDTHPANNALVVTYEILVTLINKNNNRELAGRNKRHQLQINIPALDKLNSSDLKANKLVINIQELSSAVFNKCPLLHQANNILEDIQLHLLYLVGRKQSQLLLEQQRLSIEETNSSSSLANSRLRSAGGHRSSARRPNTSRSSLSSAGSSSSSAISSDFYDNVYSYLHAKELRFDDLAESFLLELDQHLDEVVSNSFGLDPQKYKKPTIEELDVYLEGLYGDNAERLNSMLKIRQLTKDDEANLHAISSNRLLLCAIIRTLRDLNNNQHHQDYLILCESIYYLLIKFTLYSELYRKIFIDQQSNKQQQSIDLINSASSSTELVGLLAELLNENVNKAQLDLKNIFEYYYYTNSLLIITLNLLYISDTLESKEKSTKLIEQRILLDQPSNNRLKFVQSLLRLFCLEAKCLRVNEIRLISKPEKVIHSIRRIIAILRKLSIFKEFTIHLRSISQLSKQNNDKLQSDQFLDSLIVLLDTLQLTRPGSGASGLNNNQDLITDKQILNELFELEIEVFGLINNILYDVKVRLKLIKCNLLKCVLRNLVVFLARSSTLSPYNRSIVLLRPLKCLYELSCDNVVKTELFRSKIIIKCLLEYLLSCSTEFKSNLELLDSSTRSQSVKISSQENQITVEYSQGQIFAEAREASHYIIGVWLNLSARKELPVYGSTDVEFKDLIAEYFEISISKSLRTFVSSNSLLRASKEHQLMMYLHLKLIRNLTHFLEFKCDKKLPSSSSWLVVVENFDTLSKWIHQIDEASRLLMAREQTDKMAIPMSVECLAILGNLLIGLDKAKVEEMNKKKVKRDLFVFELIERLTLRNIEECEGENDDLLLVSIVLLGVLARKYEICLLDKTLSSQKITNACNFILENRSADMQIILNTLFTLLHLTNHMHFLKELARDFSAGSKQAEILVEKLTLLSSHNNSKVSKLAVLILDKLGQLEEQMSIEESVIKQKRFTIHNSKWLSALKDSYKDSELDDLGDHESGHQIEEFSRVKSAQNNRDFYTLQQDIYDKNVGNFSVEQNNNNYELDELIEEDDLVSEDDLESSIINEPDLNVIDSNSMTKHLNWRQQFRNSELLKK